MGYLIDKKVKKFRFLVVFINARGFQLGFGRACMYARGT